MSADITPRLNIWLEHDGKVVLSPWRLRLLEAVDRAGSISGAAELLNVPYKLAWERLAEMEEGSGSPLLERHVGGSHGGGASLTPEGRALIDRFAHFMAVMEVALAEEFSSHFPRI